MISKVKTRLFLILFVAGMLGVVSFLLLDLSAVAALMPVQAGADVTQITPALKVLTLIQPTVILVVAVVIGVALASRVGLSAPFAESLASGRKSFEALRPQLLPGLIGGFVGAVSIVVTAAVFRPFLFASTLERIDKFLALMPYPTRLLYGGITEELLLRWGLMTLLVWASWRLLQKGVGTPTRMHFVSAILISALIFGVGHLPVAIFVLQQTTIPVILFVILANSGFGIVAGYLYWRRGLEAAIIAHMFCHVLLAVANAVGMYF